MLDGGSGSLFEEILEMQRKAKALEEQVRADAKNAATAEEEAARVDAENSARIPEDYARKAALLREGGNIHGETFGVGERRNWTEKLEQTEAGQVQQLESVKSDAAVCQERVAKIEEAAGDYKMPPEVKSYLASTKNRLDELTIQAEVLSKELEKTRGKKVTPEEEQRFQRLQSETGKIYSTLDTIDENPKMVEIMVNEAETEGEKVNEVVNYASRLIPWQYLKALPEKEKYIDELTRIYWREECQALGIDTVANPKDKLRLINELARNMILGLENSNYFPDNNSKQQAYSGKMLGSLLGVKGSTFAYPNSNMAGGYGDNLSGPGNEHESGFSKWISVHQNSVNFARAFAAADAGNYAQNMQTVAGLREDDWHSYIDSDIIQTGKFEIDEKTGAILPKNADEGEKELTRQTVESVKERARGVYAGIKERVRAEKAEQIAKIDQAIAELKALEAQAVKIEIELDRVDKVRVEREMRGYEYDLDETKSNGTNLENQRRDYLKEHLLARWFNLGMGDMNTDINNNDLKIEKLKEKIKKNEEILSKFQFLRDNGSSLEIRKRINQLRSQRPR